MVKTTVREALRDAMAEEMRRDERVFVMGEEVAEYQGAYKVTQGLLQEFGDAGLAQGIDVALPTVRLLVVAGAGCGQLRPGKFPAHQ